MLGSIKFLAWSIKLKTSYGILSSLKLTTLYLICNCQISSILVLFLYFKLLCCLGIFVVLLPLIRLFQHLENVYFIFQMFSGTFGENRSLKWIHVICHTRDIPQNEKFAKLRLVKMMLVKIEAVSFIVFKSDYSYFLQMLVEVLIWAQMDWIYRCTMQRKKCEQT